MFSYDHLVKEIKILNRLGVETGVIGESLLGHAIPYVFIGKKNGKYMVVQGSIHAREHLTALLTLYLCKYLVKNNLPINGGIFFVPMTNPDGVCLCQQGAESVEEPYRSRLLQINGNSDFSLWKANANGVDLNNNFDAKWGESRQSADRPSSQGYPGEKPLSEPESRRLAEFTSLVNPCVTLSYHLKGEEVYWDFGQNGGERARDKRLADAICAYTGYSLADGIGSVGGYKDWCVQKFGIPSFTVEVGSDEFAHPFPYDSFGTIFKQNVDLPRRLLNSVVRDLQ